MSDIDKLTKLALEFRDARDWKQFHNPKDLAISLSLEASEVLEHFQWKDEEEVKKYLKSNKSELADELADVLSYLLLMSDTIGINLYDAFIRKLEKNDLKYPTEKSKGNHKKYTDLK